jgi:putative acetyltransferase
MCCEIVKADSSEGVQIARELFREYAAEIGIDLSFQNFEQEVAELPGKYSPPGGVLLLAMDEKEPLGCVALRPLEAGICEMKRLYVRPSGRGRAVGRRLVEALIAHAENAGYRKMRLDTLVGRMDRAIALYRELGFVEIAPYAFNPHPGALYLELQLQQDKYKGEMAMNRVESDCGEGSPVKVSVSIVVRSFEPRDAEAFRSLNAAWIEKYFGMEDKDHVMLNHPMEKIIAPGGHIYMAFLGEEAVGCCALLLMADGVYEIAKMAVKDDLRGMGIGRKVLEYTVAQARTLGARKLYLETNSTLRNAIHLYEAVGFRHIAPVPSPYLRADVFMEMELNN